MCSSDLLFYHKYCQGCPVSHKTGEKECDGSPYGILASASSFWDDVAFYGLFHIHPFIAFWRAREAFLLAERDEISFLEGLLPGEH